jgi:DNA (cytosine-5)-methyltransferase 1
MNLQYKKVLDDMWRLHEQSRSSNAPTIISTFAGCGGSSLGYSMAGYKELLMIEWDANAVSTFKKNFNVPVFHGDINKITGDDILKKTGLKRGELYLLDGSPPCQGFSTSGNRDPNDPRNMLFTGFSRLLKELSPKVFVMENVAGMVRGRMKRNFRVILRHLKQCGYQVKAWLLNAKNYMVPQSRERLIFIGIRNDLDITPSCPDKKASCIVTVKNALDGVVNKHYSSLGTNSKTLAVAKMVKPGQAGCSVKKDSYFNLKRIHNQKPSNTIPKSSGGLFHPIKDRPLTIEECKRIGSFPDQFKFIGSFREQWNRIGNSVPPLFMKAIAEHILNLVPADV